MKKLSLITAALAALLLAGCKGFLPSPGGPEASGTPSAGKKGEVVINEVVSSNTLSHRDPAYGTPDWIEFKNIGDAEADISGRRIADNPAMRSSLTFPEGTVIAPGGFLTVYCIADFEAGEGELIAPFSISRTGEKLYFSDDKDTALLDVPVLSTDVSYARGEDGVFGFSSTPTFGEENANIHLTLSEAEAASAPIDGLRISELVTGSEGWAELKNISESPIELSLFYLSDDPNDPSKWRFPEGSLEPGALVTVSFNAEAPVSEIVTSFRVSRSENGLYLFDSRGAEKDRLEVAPGLPAGISAIKVGGEVLYTAYSTPGEANSTDTFENAEWSDMDISSAPVIINEVLADNKYGIKDSYGDRSDWVELLNQSDSPVDLSYYYLSDDPNDPLKWQLPKVALLPHEYVVVFLSGNESLSGEIHAPFKLSNGETVCLTALQGMFIDKIEIPLEINPNVSAGRNSENQIRYYPTPTPGGPNSSYGLDRAADAGGFNARSVYISEVSAVQPAHSDMLDWIELYNPTGSAVSLSGWSLTNDPDEPRKYSLDKYSLRADGYALIYCGGAGSSSYAPFGISPGGSTLFLIGPDGGVHDVFETGAGALGVTSGRVHLSQTGERVFFKSATPGAKNAEGCPTYAAAPEFSRASLYSDSAFKLELTCSTPGAVIRYTTDGSAPTSSSKEYTSPISVSENAIIRAKAFAEGLIPSETVAHTYVIGAQHTLPVVCISLSHSDYSKMYYAEMRSNGSVKKGEEVPCYMEYYVGGRPAIQSGAGVKVSGASTAVYPQKSMKLIFRAGYGRSSLDYPFFDDSEVSSFRSILLRNGGQDAYYAHIRDTFVSKMCLGMNLDVAVCRPVIVYMNGQYRGIYDLKENMNEDFLVNHYGVSRSRVEIARRNGWMRAGTREQWDEMLNMCKTLDFSKKENFEKLKKYVDTDAIMDYLIARTYFYDYDMYNQKYWHTNDNKVRWRAVLFDSDYALYGNNPSANILYTYFNKNGVVSPHGYVTQMDIYCACNQNAEWREQFIIRYIKTVKTRFNAERALSVFDSLVETYRPEMPRQISKWHMPNSMEKWQTELAGLRDCISKRPEKALKNLKSFYGLSDSKYAELEKKAMGN